jgi:hypothetical protein
MGSIVSPWTASTKRERRETCSLVFLFSFDSVRELLEVVHVRTPGHKQAGLRSLIEVMITCRQLISISGFEWVAPNRSEGGRKPPN